MNWMDVWQAVGQVASGFFLGLSAFAYQRFSSWRKSKNLRQSINHNMKIKDVLIEIKTAYEADRALLFQFHNGDHYVAGGSIQKMSLTHFATSRGISPPIGTDTDLINIPVSYLDTSLSEIINKSVLSVAMDDFPEDSYLSGIFRRDGCEHLLMRCVYNRRHEVIGLLVVSWVNETKVSPSMQQRLKEYTAILAGDLLTT